MAKNFHPGHFDLVRYIVSASLTLFHTRTHSLYLYLCSTQVHALFLSNQMSENSSFTNFTEQILVK